MKRRGIIFSFFGLALHFNVQAAHESYTSVLKKGLEEDLNKFWTESDIAESKSEYKKHLDKALDDMSKEEKSKNKALYQAYQAQAILAKDVIQLLNTLDRCHQELAIEREHSKKMRDMLADQHVKKEAGKRPGMPAKNYGQIEPQRAHGAAAAAGRGAPGGPSVEEDADLQEAIARSMNDQQG